MHRFVLLLLLVIVGNGFLAATPVTAQKHSVSWEDVLDVGKELHPPGCTDSMTADYCTLISAYDLRAEIWEMLVQGKKKDQIIDELVQKYGERILAAPTVRGFNWFAWFLPGIGITAGGVMIGYFVRSWVRRTSSRAINSTGKETVSPQQMKEIEQELRRIL